MPPKLWPVITDLNGAIKAVPNQFSDLQVEVPLNDSRLAGVTLSIYDDSVLEVKPLLRLLKVYYGDELVFWGYILKPTWSGAGATVRVEAHDPTLRLKHHYHRYGDYVVDIGFPYDGRGMRYLLESSIPIDPQLTRGVPGNGIMWGSDDTTHQDGKGQPGAIWDICQRGENVWDSVNRLSSAVVGPDFEFVPSDELEAGYFVELNTADVLGTTRRATFDYGFGESNLADFTYEPDGDAVRNYMVVVYPGGERNREDSKRKALYHDEAAWGQYGIWQGWESSGQKDTQEVLAEKAKAWVKAYAYPPDFFSIAPRPDTDTAPQYMRDFKVGDLIFARARRGHLKVALDGRITKVVLSQRTPSTYATTAVECVPNIDNDPEGVEEPT